MAPIYEYGCPNCKRQVEAYQTLSEAEQPSYCKVCYLVNDLKPVVMTRLISMPAPHQFGPGIPGTSSQAEWSAKQRAKLEARSNAYDKTPDGQEQIHKSLLRQRKNGLL